MSNVIGFLASVGSDVSLRYSDPPQLLCTLKTQPDAILFDAERETMYCSNFIVKPPKKAPTKRNSRRKAPTVRH